MRYIVQSTLLREAHASTPTIGRTVVYVVYDTKRKCICGIYNNETSAHREAGKLNGKGK